MGHTVFICHASEDRDIAVDLVTGLESRGVSCWIAPRDIAVGAQYAQAIVAGISGARALVLVFSESANRSPHVAREVERAVSRGMPIIPVRLGEVEPTSALEYYISDAQWLDVTPTTLDDDIEQLARAVGEKGGETAGGSARAEAQDALAQAVSRFGLQLVDDARRVEAILRDLAGESRAEIAALSVAAAEGVGRALLESSLGTRTSLKVQLARRLENNRALAADMAEWAVETWSAVLGVHDPVAEPPGGEDVEPTRPVGAEPEWAPAPPTAPPVPPSQIPDAGTPDQGTDAALGATIPAQEGGAAPQPTSRPAAPPPPPFAPPSTPPPVEGAPAAPPTREPAGRPAATPGPAAAPQAVRPAEAPTPKRRRRRRVVVTTVVAFVALGAIGSLFDNDDGGTTPTTGSTAPSSSTTTPPTTSITSTATGSSTNPFPLPFSESFAGPSTVWETSTLSNDFGTRTWEVVDGRLTLEAEANSGRFYSKLVYFDLPDAYTVSVDASQADSDTVACGISLRDPQAETGFLFTIDAVEQEYRIDGLAPEGSTNALVSATFDSVIRGQNLIEVAVDEANLTFLVNGTTLLQHPAGDLPVQERIGVVGLVAAGQTERCFFDNLSVTAGVAEATTGGSGTLQLSGADLGPGWTVHDVDQSQTRDGAFPIHCAGGSEASTTVRIDRVESVSLINEDRATYAFVLVAESEPDLIDALFSSQRANLAFCDAGGGSLRPLASVTPPDLGTDAIAARSLLGSTDDTQFALVRVSPTTALYTLLYSPFEEMDARAGNDFAASVFDTLF